MFLINFNIPEVRQAWRAGVVCAGSLFLSLYVLKINSPQWVVLSALVCLQANFGASLKRAKERLLGTLLACCVGLFAVYFLPNSGMFLSVLLLFATVIAIYKTTLSYAYSVFAATIAVVAVYALFFHNGKYAVLLRLEDVALGVAFGTLGALFLWPDFARKKFSSDLILLTQNKELLFVCILEWIDGKKTSQEFFDQKLVSAQNNQSARVRIMEMSYEIGRRILPLKLYEKFIFSQERIHYILVTIFNVIRNYDLKDKEDFVFFRQELENVKSLYESAVKFLPLSKEKTFEIEQGECLVFRLNEFIQKMHEYELQNNFSVHKFILLSNLEWLAKEIKAMCLEIKDSFNF